MVRLELRPEGQVNLNFECKAKDQTQGLAYVSKSSISEQHPLIRKVNLRSLI
jgi:hypothetical protein